MGAPSAPPIDADRAGRESAELFAKAFRASPNSISVTDVETGEIVDINEGFERFFGYAREDVVGRTTNELGIWRHASDRRRFVDALQRDGAVRNFRTRLVIRSGQVRSCLVSAEVVTIGGRARLIGVVEDVTEREQAEQALRESEERFHKAFKATPNAITISDAETSRLIDVNEGFEKLCGYTREQVIGRTIVELGILTQAERDRLVRALAVRGSVRNLEAEFTNARGEKGVALASAEAIELHGRRCLIFGVLDITDARRVEKAKAELEDELRQVQKMEAIGTLAGGIAHDFNNILGAMLAYTEIAKLDAAGAPQILESLEEIQKAGERAKELVRQILTFSRRQPQERRTLRLQPVVEEALKLIRSTLPTTIRIVPKVSPAAEHVHADPTQIHQVIVNLCTNAAHAMREGPGELTIELTAHHPGDPGDPGIPNLSEGRYVRLTVSDTGHGMDPETMQRVFEPFFTTKSPGEGTGLGLAVVHGIVRDHDGTVHVQSEPGRGTSFHVVMPVRVTSAGEHHLDAREAQMGNRERILFIDDEPALCGAAKKLLEKLNYVVTAHTSATAAVAAFRADPLAFDLVLTDLTMPAMTGVDVAAEVVRARPDIPVILATGFNARWTQEAVRTLGVRELVMKPLSLSTLARAVHAALHTDG